MRLVRCGLIKVDVPLEEGPHKIDIIYVRDGETQELIGGRAFNQSETNDEDYKTKISLPRASHLIRIFAHCTVHGTWEHEIVDLAPIDQEKEEL